MNILIGKLEKMYLSSNNSKKPIREWRTRDGNLIYEHDNKFYVDVNRTVPIRGKVSYDFKKIVNSLFSLDYLELVRKTNPDDFLYSKNEVMDESITDAERLALGTILHLLKHVGLIADGRHLTSFCMGGTCTHGKCQRSGKLNTCDTGCMYLG